MKRYIFATFLLIIIPNILFADHIPFNHPGLIGQDFTVAFQQDLRIFYKVHPDIKLLFETQLKENIHQDSAFNKFPELLTFRVGGLFRLHTNFKVGAYYQLYNRRNFNTGNLNSEHIPMIDLIPRFKLSKFIVFELRLRHEFNFYSDAEQSRLKTLWYSVKVRPKFTYYVFDEIEFKMATFLAYEIYIPINYDSTHMEHWIYYGLTFPLTKEMSLSPYAAMVFHRAVGTLAASKTLLFGLGLTFDF
ncbi:MAG TPA: hypothetical protein ENI73_04710 [Spirochaetes bacterium]|nr:hypothetical protein [Spirochaetota bacterium]